MLFRSGTSVFKLPESVDQLKQGFAALTIQTSPEEAQRAIQAIRNGVGTGNWALLGNNCTSSVATILEEAGYSPGSPGLAWQPRILWENLFKMYSDPAKRRYSRNYSRGDVSHSVIVESRSGTDYGSPRFGISTFDWVMLLMRSSQLKACVSVTDSATGTSSSQCY